MHASIMFINLMIQLHFLFSNVIPEMTIDDNSQVAFEKKHTRFEKCWKICLIN